MAKLVKIPLRVATIKDERPQSTSGQVLTAGSFQTRVLNILRDLNNIGITLLNNQFILPAGTYYIQVEVPSVGVSQNRARLQNITDSTTDIEGTSQIADSTISNNAFSYITGTIVLTVPKTFEIQHRINGGSGGGSAASFGTEVYTQVTITELLEG